MTYRFKDWEKTFHPLDKKSRIDKGLSNLILMNRFIDSDALLL